MNNVITVENLNKSYGKKRVIDNLNLKIQEGEIFGFIGENGAGKTTSIKLLLNLIRDNNKNYVNVLGENIQQNEVGNLVENPIMNENLSAIENLVYQQKLYGKLDKEHATTILKVIGLENVGKVKVRTFSLGMRQRLGIGLALVIKPKVLILDEPFNGLDPTGKADIRKYLLDLNKNENVTMLISSHILADLQLMAAKYGFMKDGKIIKVLDAESFSKGARKKFILSMYSDKEIENLAMQLIERGYIVETKKKQMFVSNENETIDFNEIFRIVSQSKVNIMDVDIEKKSLEEYYLEIIQRNGK